MQACKFIQTLLPSKTGICGCRMVPQSCHMSVSKPLTMHGAASAGLERLWAAPLHVGHCAPVRRLCWQPGLPAGPQGDHEASGAHASREAEQCETIGEGAAVGRGANGSRSAVEAHRADTPKEAGYRLASCGDDQSVRIFHVVSW